MSAWMPPMNPELLKAALAKGAVPPPAGAPPQPTGQAPVYGPPSPAPQVPPMPLGGNRVTQTPYAPQPTTPPPLPTPTPPPPGPSDDPAQNPWAKATQSSLDKVGQQQEAWSKHEAAAPKAPNYEDYKKPLWQRIVGGIATTALPMTAPAIDSALYGPWARAKNAYGQQEKQWEHEGEDLGRQNALASDYARIMQEGVQNANKTRELDLQSNERGTGVSQETGPDGKLHYFQTTRGGEKIEVPEPREQAEDRRKREEDANTPAPGARPEADPANKGQYRVKTKSGGYAPWNPKTVEEGAMVGDTRATGLFNREHPGREPKEDKTNPNGMTASEEREFNNKTRRYNGEIDALNKERAMYVGIPDGDLKTKALTGIDARLTELHGNIDKAESDIMGNRKTAPASGGGHTGGAFQVPAGAPKPTKPGQQLKSNGTVIATSADGKTWQAPQGK